MVYMYSTHTHISVKHCSRRENTHIEESLNKVCDILMQNTTLQPQHRFSGIRANI